MVLYENSTLRDAHREINAKCGAFTIATYWICDRCGSPWFSAECECDDTSSPRRVYAVDRAQLFGNYVALVPEKSKVEIRESKPGFWEAKIGE